MRTYQLAHTDLNVSRLAFGTWHLGGSWDDAPLDSEVIERADRLLKTAVEHGINLIDLADIYVRGKSDQAVGRVVQANPGLRDRVVLQAKCGIVLGGQNEPDDPGHYNFDSEHIVAALERTLQRLGTDRVELLLLHRPDPLVEPAEVAKAFDQLEAAGKVRYFGVSNHTPLQIQLLQQHLSQPLVANQLELNLLHHHLISDGFMANTKDADQFGCSGTLDYCRLKQITVQAWSPLARGQIIAPADDAQPHVLATAAELRRLAERYETTPACIAIAWLLRHPAGIQPILGTMNVDRLTESCAADAIDLSRVDWFRLLNAARGRNMP